MAQQAAATRREALANSSQLATNLRSQDFGEQSAAAQARDEITRFNALNRQNVNAQNLASRQQTENTRVNTANQQHLHNTALNQQNFDNQLRQQGAIANAYTNQANQLTQHANSQPESQSTLGSALGGAASGALSGASIGSAVPGIGTGIGAGVGAGLGALASVFAKDGAIKRKVKTQGVRAENGVIKGRTRLLTGNPEIDNNVIKSQQLQDSADATKTPKNDKFDTSALTEGIAGLSKLLNKSEPRKQIRSDIPNPYTDSGSDGAFERLKAGLYSEGGVPETTNIDALLKNAYSDENRKMAYEDGGNGTITEGVSYSGDHTPDRINKAEMVHNVAGQNRLNELLKELKQRRIDESLDEGDVSVNENQQDALLAVARGDMELEDMPEDDMINAETSIGQLMKLLSTGKRG